MVFESILRYFVPACYFNFVGDRQCRTRRSLQRNGQHAECALIGSHINACCPLRDVLFEREVFYCAAVAAISSAITIIGALNVTTILIGGDVAFRILPIVSCC